jgi:DNA-binding NtrC family response regulator
MNDKKTYILIVDDDKTFHKQARETLSYLGDVIIDEGYSEADFYSLFKPRKYNAIILDLRLKSRYEGMELLEYALNEDPAAPIVVLTGYASVETAIKSLKLGAKDYLEKAHFKEKPFLAMIEKIIIEDKARKLAEHMISKSASENQIFGEDIKIKRLLKFADWLAEEKESPIFLVGEEGTEKEGLAEYIYKKSGVKGSFIKRVIGRDDREIGNDLFNDNKNPCLIKQARGGLLFLEEVFRLTKSIQKRLLYFINTGILKNDKKDQGQRIKIQLVLGTSQSSLHLKENKSILPAFFYRIKSPELFIPPLRERGNDIVLLTQYHLSDLKTKGRTMANVISNEVADIFKKYTWPGNLWELKQVVESAALKAKLDESKEIKPKHLPFELQNCSPAFSDSQPLILDKILAETTLRYLKLALERSNGAKIEAYRYLGYPEAKRGTLNTRIKKVFETYPDLAAHFPSLYHSYMGK